MDIRGLVENMIESDGFNTVMNNPLGMLGTASRPYVGATLLPDRRVPENSYTEDDIKFRTVVANAGTRYSPVQIKQGVMTSSMDVKLFNSDIGSHFTGADYDALIRIIENYTRATGADMTKPTPEMIMAMTRWVDTTLAMPLDEINELYRWQAIINAVVNLRGDNDYEIDVPYSNPTGHRVTAGGTWSSDSYDPYPDIVKGVEFLAGKGYTVSRMFSTTPVRTILSKNAFMRTRVGRLSIIGGTVVGLPGRASLGEINTMFNEDNIPPIQLVDMQYRTQTGTGYFFQRDALVMVATTGRDASIDLGDADPYRLVDTLGYTGIGRPAGQSSPGRRIVVTPFDNKPPRVEGEAWQTSLPVIQEPEALYVITGIA